MMAAPHWPQLMIPGTAGLQVTVSYFIHSCDCTFGANDGRIQYTSFMSMTSVESVRLLVMLADVLGSSLKRVVCRCLLELNVVLFSLLDFIVQ